MAKITKLNPLAATIGAAFMASALSAPVTAAENPFAATDLGQGYQLAEKGMEGSCGEDKKGEGKCGEGKCGADKKGEGKCGEGKCGADKKGEGSCGEDKKGEGKCGEGKCGADKG